MTNKKTYFSKFLGNGHKRSHGGKKTLNVHAFDQAVLSWRAPEYVHHEKSLLWFIIAGLIALGLVIYGLETNSWTFSLTVIVFSGTYYLVYREKPSVVEVKISKIGVKIGRNIFSYSHITGFWLVYNPPFAKKVYFKMTSKFHPYVVISFDDADPVEIRHTLLKHLKEMKGNSEPFSDVLVRLFRL